MRTMGYDLDLNVRTLSIKEDNIFDYMSGYNCIYLDSGRSCIKVICQLFKNKEVLVPSYSCISVISGFTNGVKPVFYAVHDDFTIDLEDLESKITSNTGAIYITNYFGHLLTDEAAAEILRLKEKYGLLVIEDNTQSLFSGDLKVGDYALCSIRKWFPVPDGGVIYSKNSLDVFDVKGFVKDSKQCDKLYPQTLKSMVIKGLVDYPVSKIADLFAVVEQELDEYANNGEIFLMSDFTRFVYTCNSVPDMIKTRQENERYLRSLIKSPYLRNALPHLEDNECPFNMPMYCTCRDEMWQYLVDNFEIYPSVLWRTHLYDEVNTIGCTAKMGREILSLPIDQRYTKEDMENMAEAVNSFKL
ncbi:MAG: aminotransferase class I/II-fold pyridoxal phosphate-dependent enzyme [Clostridiales bacterium]|nr:aminotransferase class I/II-fold pyridoxal phosphate-dependent enzyme [Clostridiales bacterium]